MAERFFLTAPPQDGRAALEGDEARHLARVLRAAVGDEVTVFDGRGSSWTARVARIDRDAVALTIGAALPAVAPPRRPLTIAVALPKGDRQKWMVEKLTELGVARLVPLVTTRGVAEATAAARTRLERVVIEACKQCGRDTLMEIAEPRTVAAVLEGMHPGIRACVADPGGMPLDRGVLSPDVSAAVALVGPEGGFTGEELATAERAGGLTISLGPLVLRIETAAIALAARLAAPLAP